MINHKKIKQQGFSLVELVEHCSQPISLCFAIKVVRISK
jgi:hypothetical protein